jgi:uncharacterized membrane protein YczE
MLKKVNWQSFPRDFLVIQIGFALFGFAIALMIQANLGTSPWAVLAVALSKQLGTSPGLMVIGTGMVVLIGAVLLRQPIGWGTISNMLFIGPWLDLSLLYLPSVKTNSLLQLGMMLLSVFLVGMATAIYIGVDAGAGPRDSLMLALNRISGWSIRLVRGMIELIVVVLGWILGGPAGVGTVIFALLIGPSVQLNFQLFQVQPGSDS